MSMGDLATIVQYKLPIKIIVFNNRSLGMVKLEMEVMGLPESQTKMYNPDFTLIAEAMGNVLAMPPKVDFKIKNGRSLYRE